MFSGIVKVAMIFILLHLTSKSEAQELPFFLKGTWRMEGKVIYEHWDSLNINTMRGFTYRLKLGHPQVREYLNLSKSDAGIYYTATVLNQNAGKGVDFKFSKSDSTWVFENPNHDFPKKIIYKELSKDEIEVEISDGKLRSFKYKMHRLDSEDQFN